MSTERQRRVGEVWPWLPTFRAAAEYESLQRASLAIGLSVSAVSRTIKQLEEGLGFAVFVRQKTGVRLTPRGELLLEATRAGMRLLDDVLSPRDTWRLSAEPPLLPAFLASVAPLDDDLQQVPTMRVEAATLALARGELDLYLATSPLRRGTVECIEVGQLPMVRARPPGAERNAAVIHPSVDDLQSALVLARRLAQPLVLPALFAPAGWSQEDASPLTLFVGLRRGTEPRGRAVVDALRKALR